jgi:hypothetical protein
MKKSDVKKDMRVNTPEGPGVVLDSETVQFRDGKRNFYLFLVKLDESQDQIRAFDAIQLSPVDSYEAKWAALRSELEKRLSNVKFDPWQQNAAYLTLWALMDKIEGKEEAGTTSFLGKLIGH